MTRLLKFLFRNWPLKLAAIVLATLLYAGLVLSQNALTWPGRVTIEVLNQPANAFLVPNLPDVTNIRYFAPGDAAARVSRATFRATIDLSGVTVTSGSPYVTVKVNVTTDDSRVKILDFDPQQVQVRLDPLVRHTVPIQVDRGAVPAGLEARTPVLDVNQATAFGPESYVRQVIAAEARVRIQPSGIDVDQSVDLVPIDAKGDTVNNVEFDPPTVHVRIQVGSQLSTRSLPVNPSVTGTPADGYQVTSVTVDPLVVPVGGEVDLLAGLIKVDTQPVSISGATANVTRTVGLALPDNVTAAGPTTVRVTVAITAQTGTQDFQAGIVLTGARGDRTYTLGTDSVVATLGGTIASLDAISPAGFTGTVDVSGLSVGTHTVGVHFALPSGVTLVASSPGTVDITVVATPTPTPTPAASPSAIP